MTTTPPKSTSKSLLLPLCLSALFLSACATQGVPADTPSARPAPVASTAQVADLAALQQELRTALGSIDGAEIIAASSAAELHLRIPVSNGFGSGSAELRPALTRALESLLPAFVRHPEAALHIVGHTDSIGSEMHNLQLSIKRGEAVMEYLRSGGVALDRMSADGKGEAEPIADNAQESGRTRNRRVEIFVRPKD
ncbi:MAG: lipoprotein attached to the membrane by a lipid anchor [Betaproteobacteria bacterium HGW-Betaproteobacteria-21]|nr:MAG: lipoprotein attached to the membrane by a lipid anchor [Betaproteobacteria bacterium HGW-Betaproteobacteria-21]